MGQYAARAYISTVVIIQQQQIIAYTILNSKATALHFVTRK